MYILFSHDLSFNFLVDFKKNKRNIDFIIKCYFIRVKEFVQKKPLKKCSSCSTSKLMKIYYAL